MLPGMTAQAVRAVVWLKRDLRVRDHAPLAAAAAADEALALLVIEPAWLASPECHPRHVAWVLAALAELRDWSQMQMRSGTTGINTLRIYSPTKQARDHDPEGVFIRRWVPELEAVPLTFLAEPWRMPADLQRRAGCAMGRDYPAPVVDDRVALAHAKARLYALRKTATARAEADTIQDRHGSRKSGLPTTTKARGRARATTSAAAQPGLFDEVAS
jgi:deoxyribodipyrimidine photolyase